MLKAASPIVVLVVRLLLALEFVGAFWTGAWSVAFVAGATLVLTLLPTQAARFIGVNLPGSLLAAIVLFLFGSLFLGEVADFYERFWWWDVVLHFFSALSFAAMAFLFIFMLFEGDRYAAPPWALAVLSACVALAIGAVWEIFEYGMDQTFGLNMQKSGLDDTMHDLIVDLAGAVLGGLAAYFFLKGRQFGGLGAAMAEFVALNRRWYRKLRDRARPGE